MTEDAMHDWQKIETAPRDQLLLLWSPMLGFSIGEVLLAESRRPTHWTTFWLPLPAPPKETPSCRTCGGSGFIAQKQFLDDGYGEVDSCPNCPEETR